MRTKSNLSKTLVPQNAKALLFSQRAAIAKSSVRFLIILGIVCLSILDGLADTPLALSPGAPAGSYALNNLETVNLYNGHMSFAVPLLKIGGRGSAGYVMTLPLDTVWQTRPDTQCWPDPANPEGQSCMTLYYPVHGGSSTGLSPGSLRIERQELHEIAGQTLALQTLTTMTLTLPDGTQHELRDERTDGKPFKGFYNWHTLGTQNRGFLRSKIFSTNDGTKIFFISDTDIHDYFPNSAFDGQLSIFASGILLMPDGTRYRFDGGKVAWIRDVQGNQMSFTNGTNGFTVRDSLNRTVSVELAVRDVEPYGLCHRIIYTGFSTTGLSAVVPPGESLQAGAPSPKIIRVSFRPLAQQLRPGTAQGSSAYVLRTEKNLFQGLDGVNTLYNPLVAAALWLPDGRRFNFLYNSHAELARAELPTGGAYEYDHTGGLPEGDVNDGVVFLSWIDRQIYRRVVERRVYGDGAKLEGKVVYSRPNVANQFTAQDPTEVVSLTPAGVPLSRDKHYFHGNVLASLATNLVWENSRHSPWKEGREFKTELYEAGPNLQTSGPLLKVVEQDWQQRFGAASSPNAPQADPRIAETRTTLADTGQVSRKVYKYSDDPAFNATNDTFNNLTDTLEYDFGIGQPGPLLRHTHTDFLKVNPANNLDYTNLSPNLHILNLPRLTTITDGSELIVSKKEILYDEPSYPVMDNGATIPGWTAPDSVARGNATTVRTWLNVPDRWVETHSRYDQVGNVRFSWDANGKKSEFTYAAEYAFAYQTGTKTAVPDPQGIHGSNQEFTTSTAFDLHTGLPTNSINSDGQTVSTEYNDPLDRLTRINRPAGGGWTSYDYGDTPNQIYLRERTAQNDSTTLESYKYLDGLGRVVRTMTNEGNTSLCATTWTVSDTKFDVLERLTAQSSPYRVCSLTGPFNPTEWNTREYDSLGRLRKFITPDSAQVKTDYHGASALVTDQAGNQRISQTNALGQLLELWEVKPSDPALPDAELSSVSFQNHPEVQTGYQTKYTYDALGSLTKIEQGVQRRYFAYDSLSRLIRARNPEHEARSEFALPENMKSALSDNNNNWSQAFEYDDSGNLKARIDPRGVKTSYEYDGLSRVIACSYSLTGAPPSNYVAAPNAEFFFDGLGLPVGINANNAKGRVTAVKSSVSETLYTDFDAMGRVTKQSQVVDGQSYTFANYGYDLIGHLTSQTYPSGRVVNTEFDASGRIAGVRNGTGTGYFAGAAATDIANRIQYSASNAIEVTKLGNGLWEHRSFNPRQQVTQVGLGVTRSDSSTFKLDYKYGALVGGVVDPTKNNGTVQSQTITAPGLTGPIVLTYRHDALDRISAAQESGAGGWSQAFSYDRYGNRTGVTVADNPNFRLSTEAPEVEAGSNRFKKINSQSQTTGYDYDMAGNLIQEPEPGSALKKYFYDGENHLVQAKRHAGTGETEIARYAYDPEGRRVKKVVGSETTVFVYNLLGELVAEYSTTQSSAGGLKFITADTLGSTRVVTNSSGQALERHDYLPFGEEISAGYGNRSGAVGYGVNNIRQKFTQKERDDETGLDYFLARYYASSKGRFTSPDEYPGGPAAVSEFPLASSQNPTFYGELTIPQSLNKYQYTYNDPLAFTDPSGNCPVCIVVFLILASATAAQAPRYRGDNGGVPNENPGALIMSNAAFMFAGNVGGALVFKGGGIVVSKYLTRRSSTEILAEAVVTNTGRNALVEAEKAIIKNASQGKAFADYVHAILGTGQNYERLIVQGSRAPYRIPDILRLGEKTLGEIKSANYLSHSGNLKDFISFARQEGFSFNLYVRPDTVLSKPLQDQLKRIGAKVYDVVDGRMVLRQF